MQKLVDTPPDGLCVGVLRLALDDRPGQLLVGQLAVIDDMRLRHPTQISDVGNPPYGILELHETHSPNLLANIIIEMGPRYPTIITRFLRSFSLQQVTHAEATARIPPRPLPPRAAIGSAKSG